MNERGQFPVVAGLVLALLIGVVGFAAALHGAPQRAWEAYLINLLFFLGIAQGGVLLAAAGYLCNARWAGAGLYRLAEGFVGFLPVGFLLFWALYAGRHELYVWVDHPLPDKANWLNVPFMFARDGAGLLILTLVSLWFVSVSRRPATLQWAEESSTIADPPWPMRTLAVLVAILAFCIYTLLAFDLVMSMAPRWHSTLFGAYFLAGAFWSALVSLALVAMYRGRDLTGEALEAHREVLHDLGKLVFAFSVFWVYLLFSQVIVIWYGDMPSETFFLVPRMMYLPWGALGWSAFVLIWLLPFVVLMARRAKRTPAILGTICVLGLIGIWIERFVLIGPSLFPRQIHFGWIEVLITLGFFGAFGLATRSGLARVPVPTRPATWGGHE